VIVTLTLNIPQAIFTEAYLSYLGLGVPAPMASWGTLANDGLGTMGRNPILLISASAAISLTMLAFNYLGDALRDAFDPRIHRD
jgi:oligopeptide transport system permease protein